MKKRIGSKLYNTETSELVYATDLGNLYRKRTRDREFFLVNGKHILPMTEAEARAMLGESSYIEKKPENARIMIGVDRETHAKISQVAKKKGVPISEFMRDWAKTL